MRTRELIKLMPTQFKMVNESSSIYVGHHIPLIGTWSKETGYVKLQSLVDEDIDESLACPILAVVTTKFGSKPVTLSITSKISELKETREYTKGDYTYYKKIYQPTTTEVTGDLLIPRFTRPHATFVVTSIGQMNYEITSITDNIEYDTGAIEFYALGSTGSKIIYWLGIHNLATELREILRPWIAPCVCNRCNGTGRDPESGIGTCRQCLGYKYEGYNSSKSIQKQQGFDVGLGRDLVDDWEGMSQTEYNTVEKFMNKCWTQKWWVTPTVKEIKRLYAHFYQIGEDEVEIVERLHPQEPVWSIFLPLQAPVPSPFGPTTDTDRDLMKYIAETITPAGVSVFVGFWDEIPNCLGSLDDGGFGDCYPMLPLRFESSSEPEYSLWGMPRWDLWNGWQDACIDFETTGESMPFECTGEFQPGSPVVPLPAPPVYLMDDWDDYEPQVSGYYYGTWDFRGDRGGEEPAGWTIGGSGNVFVKTFEVGGHKNFLIVHNDTCVHTFPVAQVYGTIDFWIRSPDADLSVEVRIGSTPNIRFFIASDEFQYDDGSVHTITSALDDTWYHVSIDFECGSGGYKGLAADTFYATIDDVQYGPYSFENAAASLDGIDFRTDVDANYGYFDAIGFSFDKWYYQQGWNKLKYPFLNMIYDAEYNFADDEVAPADITGTYSFTEDVIPPVNYPATYSFTEDEIGDNPSGWTVDETGGTVTIIAELGNHNKVVQLYDTGAGGADFTAMTQTFTGQTDGTIEFWFRGDSFSGTKDFNIEFFNESAAIICRFRSQTGQLQHYPGSWTNTGDTLLDDVWYHFRIVFDCSSDTYDLYIDGILTLDDQAFENNSTTLNTINLTTGSTDTDYHCYIDAIDYSWSDGYYTGRNQIPPVGTIIAGTYNFREDLIGAEPSGFMIGGGGTISVVGELGNHNKVLSVDNSTCLQIFTAGGQSSGYIEYWYYNPDADKSAEIRLGDNTNIRLIQHTDVFYAYNGAVPTNVLAALDNVWYHIKIYFDCNIDKWSLWINGILEADSFDFFNVNNSIDRMDIRTDDDAEVMYFDAIGYSWDDNYTVGDNLYPLEFHSIEGGGSVSVIESLDGHNQVVQCYQTTAAGAIIKQYFSAQENGVVEFWVQFSTAAAVWDLFLTDSAENQMCRIYFDASGNVKVSDALVQTTVASYIADTWYHFKISFDIATDLYSVWMNGILVASDFDFCNSEDVGIEKFIMYAPTTAGTRSFYLDAIDYSWSDGYSDGRNLYPQEWNTVEDGGPISVIKNLNGHNNIIKIEDTSATYGSQMWQSLNDEEYGAVEFWIRTNDPTDECFVRLYHGATAVLGIEIDADILYYLDNGGWNNSGFVPLANTWYHIKFTFDATTGTYNGLAQYEWNLYVNGELITSDIDFASDEAHVDKIVIETGTTDTGHIIYIDAVDYSWADGYYDNRNLDVDVNNFTKLRHGRFKGTYSFENDADGADPSGWTCIEGANYTVQVISGIGDHRKVVEIFENAPSSPIMYNDFIPQESGTIEWWFRTSSITNGQYASIRFYSGGYGGTLANIISTNATVGGQFQYYDGGWHNIQAFSANTWYHFKLIFDCATDTYNLYINDVLVLIDAAFVVGVDNLDNTEIRLAGGSYNYYAYYDAISYSWDADYVVGDNKKIYYEEEMYQTPLLGAEYSVFEEDGNIIYKMHDNTESGYYPATYSFTDDMVGDDPTGWTVLETGGTINVISDLGGHDKVVECQDTSAVNKVQMKQTFSSQTSGTIEYWFRKTGNTMTWYNTLCQTDGAGSSVIFQNVGDKWRYYNFHTAIDSGAGAVVLNTWYHIRIDFDTATDTFSIYINGVNLCTNSVFYNNADYISFYSHDTHPVENGCHFYIDAIGYSWDENYVVGDNTVEVGCQGFKYLDADQTNAILSVMVKGNMDEYARIYLKRKESDQIATSIKIDSNVLYYLNGKEWQTGPAVLNGWTMFSFDFDVIAGTYSLYVNHDLIEAGMSLQQTVSCINEVVFETKSGSLDYTVYTNCMMISDTVPCGEADPGTPSGGVTDNIVKACGYMCNNIDVYNANDQHRHVCRMKGSGAYLDWLLCDYGMTGMTEWWIHPQSANMRTCWYDGHNNPMFWLDYDIIAHDFKDRNGVTLDRMMDGSEKHVRVKYDIDVYNVGAGSGATGCYCGFPVPETEPTFTGEYSIYLNRELKVSGLFTGHYGISHVKWSVESDGTGFIDAIGWTFNDLTGAYGYEEGDNWQRLYYWGWGIDHDDYLGSISDLLESYFYRDRPILW